MPYLTDKRVNEIVVRGGYPVSVMEGNALAQEVFDLRRSLAEERAKKATHTTIHALLVSVRGNQTKLARQLGINRTTLHKYMFDIRGERHCVINGVFMSSTSDSLKWSKKKNAESKRSGEETPGADAGAPRPAAQVHG